MNPFPLGFQWQTFDPFLFCVHHLDLYPKGNEAFGPAESLAGRDLGQDFEPKNGYRMYHGETVPGFPAHPHRGFETITVVRRGIVDHADSTGASGRYGSGDTQWMTAGNGIQHSEMFPLLDTQGPNTAELFQIWLNLPKRSKRVEPHYTMFWDKDVPRVNLEEGRAEVEVIAGRFDTTDALAPPPASYAADPEAEIAVWVLRLREGARLTLPPAKGAGTLRTLYHYEGEALDVGGRALAPRLGTQLDARTTTTLTAPVNGEARLLVLQGRPIGEPVAQYGPFVMNTQQEIMQAFEDYRRTEFGGWPWPRQDMVFARERGRFAEGPSKR